MAKLVYGRNNQGWTCFVTEFSCFPAVLPTFYQTSSSYMIIFKTDIKSWFLNLKWQCLVTVTYNQCLVIEFRIQWACDPSVE